MVDQDNLQHTVHFRDTAGLDCTNTSRASNVVINFIFEPITNVSEPQTKQLSFFHCTTTWVLNLTLSPWCLN